MFDDIRAQEIDELLHFVEGLRGQMRDVALLKATYEEEDRVTGHLPPWKRAVGDRHVAPSAVSPVAPHVRYAPEMTINEMEKIYEGLPENWFHISVAARMCCTTGPEMRRYFYWMSKRKYIMFSNATQLFRKRIGAEKGNYAATSSFQGPFAGLPRTEKKPPRIVT